MQDDLKQLVRDFCSTLRIEWSPPPDLARAARAAIVGCAAQMDDANARDRRLLAIVNAKFRFNKDRFQHFLDEAAAYRVFPNYHDKAEIQDAFDESDSKHLAKWIEARGVPTHLRDRFDPVNPDETIKLLSEQLRAPKIARSDARKCRPAERRQEILRSLFGSYVFRSYPAQAMYAHFNADCRIEHVPDFYQHLARFHPTVLHRHCALVYLVVNDRLRHQFADANAFRDGLYAFLRETYNRLSNHCYLAIRVEPFREGDEDGQWRLFSDLVLYAEKHREINLKIGYFPPERIARATLAHIPHLDLKVARFDMANEGFFYRDCFVLLQTPSDTDVETTDAEPDLLLMFERNERDETLIPCPACRSRNVAGNSYPILGIRSWECQNPICPERSAFDRGNRYSLAQIIKQEAIKSEVDQIPEASLRRWKLDVVHSVDDATVAEMLLRHFTLHGDTTLFINSPRKDYDPLGRELTYEHFRASDSPGEYARFQESSLFHRFAVDRPVVVTPQMTQLRTKVPDVELIQGDCFDVLSRLRAATIDGAATSPPYYNARSYSAWPNIYCYLYDMYNAARQVYRVLKPGAVYLFNIFDYFDNENSVVLSTMGKKRMILGAYIVNLFRRIGFRVEGNVAWYKGEIEGKRNFNQGNRSPYYQFPFNCWEHVFVFRKPGPAKRHVFPTILAAKPVVKMVRGENILGHSAPYPPAIPELLIDQLEPGATLLDPYSGSMTTGRAAYKKGLRSLNIELHSNYCELGLRLLYSEGADAPLFGSLA